MKKIMSIMLGGFLLATSMNALELSEDQTIKNKIIKLAEKHYEIATQVNLERELERALNNAISDSKRVNDIVDRFKSKKEFLEASKRILEKWERDIDKDLEEIAKEKKQ